MIDIEKEIVYAEGKITVRRSIGSDVDFIASRLCQGDIDEIWVSHHLKPQEGLEVSFKRSLISFTVESGEEIICMLGVTPENLMDKEAMIWMVVSKSFKKIGIPFLWKSKDFINIFLQSYPKLYNWVWIKHIDSIRWLKFIGANLEDAIPYGIEKELFYPFYFGRK